MISSAAVARRWFGFEALDTRQQLVAFDAQQSELIPVGFRLRALDLDPLAQRGNFGVANRELTVELFVRLQRFRAVRPSDAERACFSPP